MVLEVSFPLRPLGVSILVLPIHALVDNDRIRPNPADLNGKDLSRSHSVENRHSEDQSLTQV